MSQRLRIAARQSALARLQATQVAQALQAAHAGLEVEFHFSESLGDQNQHDPLWKMPEKGVFTSDLSQRLVEGACDLVVHSWKDLPLEADALVAGAPVRADPADVVLFAKEAVHRWRDGGRLVVLSSSPRRAHNLGESLASLLPHPPGEIAFVPVRGNIPTRLRKLLEGASGAHALVVAKAALDRLLAPPDPSFLSVRDEVREALAACRWLVVPLSLNPAAPAQGALALETRPSDERTRALVEAIVCRATTEAVRAERSALAAHGGGCHQKIGVSVVSTAWGPARFERGQRADGSALRHRSLGSAAVGDVPGARPWSSTLAGVALFDRVEQPGAARLVAEAGDGACWYVSHPDAWPASLTPEVVKGEPGLWTAGVMTWRRLASRGFWVQGCDDGLGESTPDFSAWTGRAMAFRKLGHLGSPELGAGLATYRLATRAVSSPREEWRTQGRTHFYWKSFSQFEAVTAACPEVVTAHHACGPGSTARSLSGRVTSLEVCLDESDWRERHGIHRFD